MYIEFLRMSLHEAAAFRHSIQLPICKCKASTNSLIPLAFLHISLANLCSVRSRVMGRLYLSGDSGRWQVKRASSSSLRAGLAMAAADPISFSSDRAAGVRDAPARPPTYHKMRFEPIPRETKPHLAHTRPAEREACTITTDINSIYDGLNAVERNISFYRAQKLSEFQVWLGQLSRNHPPGTYF